MNVFFVAMQLKFPLAYNGISENWPIRLHLTADILKKVILFYLLLWQLKG